MQCVHYKGECIFYCEVTDMPDTIESPVLEVFQGGERLFLRLLAQTIIPWMGARQMLLAKSICTALYAWKSNYER